MLRAPICRQSATRATASTSPVVSTSVTIASPVSARASSRMSSPATPRPRKLYGDERGLNAPPRRIVAPAARTARAVARVCSRDSTEHGPAMIASGAPAPTGTGPMFTTVSSGITSRDASLNGRLTGTTSATPGRDSTASAAARDVDPNVPIAIRSAPGSGIGVMPNSAIRATTASISRCDAPRFMTTSISARPCGRRSEGRPPTRDAAPSRRGGTRVGSPSASSTCSRR